MCLCTNVLFTLILATGAYPRPNLLPGRDPTLGLHHPSDVLARPFADQVRYGLLEIKRPLCKTLELLIKT